MSDPSRFSSPSRKSRFRAQGRAQPAAYAPEPGVVEETPVEEVAAAEEAGTLHDPYAPAPDEELAVDSASPETYAEADGLAEAPAEEEDAIPAGLRLTRSPDEVAVRRGFSAGMVTSAALAALAAGALAGYFFGNSQGRNATRPVLVADAGKNKTLLDLSGATQTAVDAAFDDTKHARYDDARKAFEAIFAAHSEWPSMEIEAARAALYARDFQGARRCWARQRRSGPWLTPRC